MAYSDKVVDHFDNPRNMGSLDKADRQVGTGIVGAPECGDVMRLQIKVEDGVISDAKFKTFGCGSAIASSSLATEWIKGRSVDEALKIKNTDIVEELSLPPVKIHCSVLAEDAIKAAVGNYRVRTLIDQLNEGDDAAKLDAARQLLAFNPAPKDATSALETAAGGAGELAEAAKLALHRIQIHTSVAHLDSLDPTEREQAAKSLREFDPRSFETKTLQALERAGEDDNEAVKAAAAETLKLLEASGQLTARQA